MGNEHASTFGRGGRHPLMHRTETIDYVLIDGRFDPGLAAQFETGHE